MEAPLDSDEEADADALTLESVRPGPLLDRAASSLEEQSEGGPTFRSLDDGSLTVVPLSVEAQAGPALDVAFLTWNINGNPLNAADAKVWATCAGPADAYFVAIQELIDIEAKEGLPDRATREANSAAAAAEAASVLQAVLSEACGEPLMPLGEPIAMLAIFLVGFARPSVAAEPGFPAQRVPAHYTEEAAAALEAKAAAEDEEKAKKLRGEAEKTRAKVGQKGGVAVGVKLGGVGLCVLNAHLPAGEKESSTAERDAAALALRSALPLASLGEGAFFVLMGDVNSRTRIGHLQQEEAQQLVGTLTRKASTRVELQEVHEFDELVGGFASYTGDLCEAEISWAPTYKFKKSDFDAKRAPSYCDRVLWRADPNVLPRLYAHCPEVTTSDHKPVAAVLSVAKPPAAAAS